MQVALVKGKGKDSGFNDDNIKALINPLVGLRDGNGTTVDEEYFVVYKNGKPVNIWKDNYPRTVTGLKDNGEPDERTTKGKERAANAKTFEQDTGLTKEGQASERTKLGQHHEAAVMRAQSVLLLQQQQAESHHWQQLVLRPTDTHTHT